MFDPSINLDDLAWLRDQWPGKLIVKGITSLQDATDCVDVGVDAVVISNHGGRQLDRSPASLDVLPRFVDALGDQTEIMVDGGFLSGSDVVVALCLGATAVLVGRAYLYGLMAAAKPAYDEPPISLPPRWCVRCSCSEHPASRTSPRSSWAPSETAVKPSTSLRRTPSEERMSPMPTPANVAELDATQLDTTQNLTDAAITASER